MIDPVPTTAASAGAVPEFLETAIYLYFVGVGLIGLYLHGRILRGYRRRDRAEN